MKQLAVVIPCFNDLEGLKITLASLRKADPEGELLEIAVVDGAGGDDTATWLLEASSSWIDHRMSAPDQGIYHAMNIGTALTSAPWLYYLGAGDTVDPDVLQMAITGLQASVHDLHIFGVRLSPPLEKFVPASYPARWDSGLVWRNIAHHQGLLYRRSAVPSIPYATERHVLADYELNLWLYTKGKVALLNDVELCLVRPGGISRNSNRRLYVEEWAIKRSLLRGGKKWVHPFWLLAKFLRKI